LGRGRRGYGKGRFCRVSHRIVLDSSAFDTIDSSSGAGGRDFLRKGIDRGAEVLCSAVTLAEVCRGEARTRRAEAAVARDRGGQRIIVVPTDRRRAVLVGSILHATGSPSSDIASAHVIAVCAGAEIAVVITNDADEMARLSSAIPGTMVLNRRPGDHRHDP